MLGFANAAECCSICWYLVIVLAFATTLYLLILATFAHIESYVLVSASICVVPPSILSYLPLVDRICICACLFVSSHMLKYLSVFLRSCYWLRVFVVNCNYSLVTAGISFAAMSPCEATVSPSEAFYEPLRSYSEPLRSYNKPLRS